MKYFIITFGCQMNHADTKKIAAKLRIIGHCPANDADTADLIVVNACSVRQSAVHRVYGQMENHKNKKIIIAGCLLPQDARRLAEKGAEIWRPDDYWHIPAPMVNNFSALIPIMTGCDNYCSYCVVPHTRGAEKSRPAEDIIREIKQRLNNGAKEIILLGQNVNSYRSPAIGQKTTVDFPRLLRLVNTLPGNFWLSFITSHPKDMSEKLIAAAAQCRKVAPYIHLPLQSGDNIILKKMNRRYTAARYENLVKKIRAAFRRHRPTDGAAAVTTDIIVGFPGETEQQFQNTARLMRQLNFDMAYLAQYSPRIGTAAARLPDNISRSEKKRREKILNGIIAKTALNNNRRYLGQTVAVLIKKIKNGFAFGKTSTQKTVRLTAQNLKTGDLIKAIITEASPWGLIGKQTKNLPPENNTISAANSASKIIVVCGQTATGKSDLAVALARQLNSPLYQKKFGLNGAEIISADSRQVYRGLDLGSGKITAKEMRGIPHYLLDVASPRRRFSAAQYQKLAQAAIRKIQAKNKLPIICGGAGFYIQTITDNLGLPPVKPNFQLRAKLEKKSTAELFTLLKKKDPRRAAAIDRHNPRRLVRALEIIATTGQTIPELAKTPTADNLLILGIEKNPRELARRIKIRLAKRLKQGMLTEVSRLHQQSLSWKKLESFGLEYRWLALFLQNKIGHQTMTSSLRKDIESFAKRQMTWFQRDPRIVWIKNLPQAAKKIRAFLVEKRG